VGISLRARLIAAFSAIIFLTLFVVGIGFVFILRQYQEQRELIRLGSLSIPVSYQVRALEQQGASAAELADFLAHQADELDVRIVLAGPQGMIFHDTGSSLVGQRIDLAGAQRFGPMRRAPLVSAPGQQDRRIFFIASPVSAPGSTLAERFLGRQSSYIVALVSEPLTLVGVLGEMAPRLFLAASLSLLASIGVAWVLAGSIARPLARMTHAAEAIARGEYDHEIPERGADEVGRLAAAFNAMAHEVARSTRTLRDFVANVSHDLRTPLTSIQGFSQAIVDGAVRDREGYVEAGRIINREADRMRRMVEDLLELSKIESGEVTLDLADVDLASLVRAAGERVEPRAAEHGLDLNYRIETTPTVRADPRRLERVLDNLLDNAVKYADLGGKVMLVVGLVRGPSRAREYRDRDGVANGQGDAAAQAFVSVHNTGPGIPADDLPRIFERFYQVDKSRAGAGQGSGLGLAIAQEIVQAHGGRIVANSSPAGGTELTVTIPLVDQAQGVAVVSGSPILGHSRQ